MAPVLAPVVAPILAIEGLRIGFRNRGTLSVAVADASIAVPEGGSVGLVGESGSGKSTLARSILGLLPETAVLREARRFEVAGRPLTFAANDVAGLRGSTVAMVFQDPLSSLNPLMRVGRQVREAVRLHDAGADAARRVAELLDLVRLPRRVATSYPHELSGGMRQRALMAIALACRPRLLIADEPTTALDVTTQAEILDLLRDLRRELSMALLLISHDLGIVSQLCDAVTIMYAGTTVEWGPSGDIFASPAHPYAAGLLHAAMALKDASGRFITLHDGGPAGAVRGEGCRFAGRCAAAMPRCAAEMPPAFATPTDPGHLARCWLLDGRGDTHGR